jgi:N-carbamoyl-L-amino-acid hydrolase
MEAVTPSGSAPAVRIDADRLQRRIDALAEVGPLPGGGSSRVALTDADRDGRDLVVTWMRDLGLAVTIDGVGNVVGVRSGRFEVPPVMCGSHIDTVGTGGRFDGTAGVLAGLEVIEVLDRLDIETDRPLAVAFFTDEEGARYAPDMLGSLVYVGGFELESALDVRAADGTVLGNELERIGYRGVAPCPGPRPHAYVELHIEQGPVLERAGVTIGAVTGVQGISWQELTLQGQSNHAGTTPMALRHDAGLVAAQVACAVRAIALDAGGHQVGTVGMIDLVPGMVNVVAARATMTVDLRNTDARALAETEDRVAAEVARLGQTEASQWPGASSRGSRRWSSTPGSSPSSSPWRGSSASRVAAYRQAPVTMRRCSPASARPG